MDLPLGEQIQAVNARMLELLENSRKALRGESNFGIDEIRDLREPLNKMEPVMRQFEALRTAQPELAPQLDVYKLHLAELLTILDQVRVMLLAKQANLLAGRTQLDAATHWLAAFQATR